jgi:predicted RNA-binding protein with TRAM domain
VLEGSDADVREQAIPFREGDEVLVTIVEPHMYEVDDAVAKVDGYIISVVDGGAHVGEKRLVRIEEAGRSAATAVLGRGPADVAQRRGLEGRRQVRCEVVGGEAGAPQARPHHAAQAHAQERGRRSTRSPRPMASRRPRTAMT